MKSKLLTFLPGVRWVPSDIPSQDASKPKKSRNPFSIKSHSTPSDLSIRPRKSTISLSSEHDAEIDARTLVQGQSMFFARLPIEIRKMVYEYVMGAQAVHLTMGSKRRYKHFVCEDGDSRRRDCNCRVLVGGKDSGRLEGASVSLLRTCRRVYSEAVSHLYRPHTFSLLHITHLLYLPTRLPQQRMNSIRTLRLRWAIRAMPYLCRGPSRCVAYREDTLNWERGWSIIASMKGLRDLYVVITDPSPQGIWERNWVELEEQLLRPVTDVTRPSKFELMLPFASCSTDWDMGHSKVVLKKPENRLVEDENHNG
ncbi:hypothetical protein HBI56_083570 [Parastagonospora nodorum]|nr:hypothetical protein HBH53_061430 [Parastagonospora nodorum]KAH3975288.1 hypothetical protein HBH52_125420 [Parastagonospora nodorum]KAH3978638.1 hypothetical protein HBH51_062360 [Parastagonospora nodorum]KAH3999081.1 hypothetical protein HBI10_119000 [Parastagonospora nodorum]KAH4025162.1 hypothetical protein HBI13_078190 [Parastagonospora nodorum]